MVRIRYRVLTLLVLLFCSLALALPSAALAQEKVTPRGTLKVVDLQNAVTSMRPNYVEGLV
jgi:hypothetical protein